MTAAATVPAPTAQYTFANTLADARGGSTLTVTPVCPPPTPGDPCVVDDSTGFGEDAEGPYWTWGADRDPGGGFTVLMDDTVGPNYTLAMKFSFNQTGPSYRRIIDYSGLQDDDGFYFDDGDLLFYSGANQGSSQVTYADDSILDLIVVRDDSATGKQTDDSILFTAYVVGTNGSLDDSYSFWELTPGETLPLNGDLFGFFFDDTATDSEWTDGGKIYSLSIWGNQALTPAEIQDALSQETVTFDANGGTGSMLPQSANVPTNLTSNGFTRADYSFVGWNTSADGTGTSYANGAQYAFTVSTTLYAVWVETPNPSPAIPASAPVQVTVESGDGQVAVTWVAPTSSGSYPISYYRVTASPGGATCLAMSPATSCTVTGLTNGTAYSFVVDALTGAGWGAESDPSGPVTPEKRIVSVVLDQGTRTAAGRYDRIRTSGSTVGVPVGAKLTPYIRYSGQTSFSVGRATIQVEADGSFDWTRKIRANRGLAAYVMWEDTQSNRVFWAKVR